MYLGNKESGWVVINIAGVIRDWKTKGLLWVVSIRLCTWCWVLNDVASILLVLWDAS